MTPHQFRSALKTLGLTQHTAAAALGMGKWGFQSVGKWVRGEHTIPAPIVDKINAMLEQQG